MEYMLKVWLWVNRIMLTFNEKVNTNMSRFQHLLQARACAVGQPHTKTAYLTLTLKLQLCKVPHSLYNHKRSGIIWQPDL